MTSANTFHVVVPAHQAAGEISQCIESLFVAGFKPHQITVVDDGSTDCTGEIAQAFGVCVLRNEKRMGAAETRNRGAAKVKSSHIVFVDSDVTIAAGSFKKIMAGFAQNPELSGLFGSYDNDPPRHSLVSFYRNFLHHYVHQNSAVDVNSFWTGVGVVRREAFERLGGFDRQWNHIEDVEFGVRLWKSGGKIKLDRTILCKHLKKWTHVSAFKSDLFHRAIPWTKLLLSGGVLSNNLVLGWPHRVSLLMVATMLICAMLAPLIPVVLIGLIVAAVTFFSVNFEFFRQASSRLGYWKFPQIYVLHALHYLAGGLGFLAGLLIVAKNVCMGPQSSK